MTGAISLTTVSALSLGLCLVLAPIFSGASSKWSEIEWAGLAVMALCVVGFRFAYQAHKAGRKAPLRD